MAISYINNMQTDYPTIISRKILKKADRSIPVPFEIKLHEHDKSLICDKVIRILPQKRLVAFGRWDNKPVVAKLFFDWKKAKQHSQRDASGINILTTCNIPTPQLYFKGTDQSKRIHLLIFERIQDSCTLELLWQEKNDAQELRSLMRAVIIEIATQHVLGVLQSDLHLKNFLITSKLIYTLDGGSIKYIKGPLPKKDSLDHLALFFAQLGVGADELQKNLFDLYAQSRGWIVRPSDIEYLHQSIKKWNALRWERYQKKMMRDCTAFGRKEKLTSLIMFDRDYSEKLNTLIENPETCFAQSDTQILKKGNSSTVFKIKLDQSYIVVKRYNMKNIGHWLRRCLRPSRAFSSWKLAHYLRLMGIATPKPIAFIEKNFLGLRYTSYFIMEYIEGQDSQEYFSRFRADDKDFMRTAKRILSLFNQLIELKMTHGDLKSTNMIIQHHRPVLIDLDGMKQHQNKHSFKRAFKKDMTRFIKNWDNIPSLKKLFEKLRDKL